MFAIFRNNLVFLRKFTKKNRNIRCTCVFPSTASRPESKEFPNLPDLRPLAPPPEINCSPELLRLLRERRLCNQQRWRDRRASCEESTASHVFALGCRRSGTDRSCHKSHDRACTYGAWRTRAPSGGRRTDEAGVRTATRHGAE